MNKNIFVGLIVIAIIAIGGYFYPQGKTKSIVSPVVGSLTNPELTSDFFTVNGIRHEFRKKVFSSATTTPCSIPFPNGSSTPLYFSVSNGAGTSTAMNFDVSTSSTPYATSTTYNWIHNKAVAGGAWDRSYVTPTTTASNLNADGSTKVISSSAATTTWFVLKTGPGAGGYTIPGASCQAEFIVLQQ